MIEKWFEMEVLELRSGCEMPGCSLFLGMRKDWNGLALVSGGFQMWNFVLNSKEMEGFVVVSPAIAGSAVECVYGSM